jgi:SAM-dependent methyltransferase
MIENYIKDKFGIIHQTKILNKIRSYDENYVNNSYNNYGEKVNYISHLRLGYLLGVVGPVTKILDVGYGNGDFIQLCTKIIPECFGNDISGYKIPEKCTFVDDITKDKYDVVCFFDSLEHFEDLGFVKNIKTEYIFISVPWCHYYSDSWFTNWKHRRVDEHLHHFDENSLTSFMNECGYDRISYTNIEDVVRESINEDKNILSAIFKKK